MEKLAAKWFLNSSETSSKKTSSPNINWNIVEARFCKLFCLFYKVSYRLLLHIIWVQCYFTTFRSVSKALHLWCFREFLIWNWHYVGLCWLVSLFLSFHSSQRGSKPPELSKKITPTKKKSKKNPNPLFIKAIRHVKFSEPINKQVFNNKCSLCDIVSSSVLNKKNPWSTCHTFQQREVLSNKIDHSIDHSFLFKNLRLKFRNGLRKTVQLSLPAIHPEFRICWFGLNFWFIYVNC